MTFATNSSRRIPAQSLKFQDKATPQAAGNDTPLKTWLLAGRWAVAETENLLLGHPGDSNWALSHPPSHGGGWAAVPNKVEVGRLG